MVGGGARSGVSISGAATEQDVRNWLLRAPGSCGQVAALASRTWLPRAPEVRRGHWGCGAAVGVVLDSTAG